MAVKKARIITSHVRTARVILVGFKKMVEYIRTVETGLGNGEKIVTSEEEKVKTKLRRNHDVA